MEKHTDSVKYILLMIHNLDAKQFLDVETMEMFGRVLSLSYVRCVCSVDHVKFGLTLPPKTLELLNFAFITIHTKEMYKKEFAIFENSLEQKKASKDESLKYILKSMTKAQKEIIKLLAEQVLKGTTTSNNFMEVEGEEAAASLIIKSAKGFTLKQLYENCIEEMILSSEQQLRENLLEIIDHKVFIEMKNYQGKSIYTMTYSKQVLEKIVDGTIENDDAKEQQFSDEDEESLPQQKQQLQSIDHNAIRNEDSEDDNQHLQKLNKPSAAAQKRGRSRTNRRKQSRSNDSRNSNSNSNSKDSEKASIEDDGEVKPAEVVVEEDEVEV